MVNKLIGDLAKCAQLSGHGDVLNHREIDTTLVNDRDGNKRMIIIDKAVDMAPETVATTVSKIYDTFYSKSNAAFWDKMINIFEYQHQVDWYLMISYLYMVNEDNRDNTRALVTISDACAVLAQVDVGAIESSPAFSEYMDAVKQQASSKIKESLREEIKIDLS